MNMKKLLELLLLLLFFTIFFTSSAIAMVQTGEQSGVNYKLEYPIVYTDNEIAQNLINSDIAKYIDSFKSAFDDGRIMNGGISYKIKYEDDNVVSLTLTDFRYFGGVHGYHTIHGLVYDKKTGERLPLTNYLNITPQQLRSSVSSGWAKILNSKEDTIKDSKLLRPITQIPEEYYLSGDGSISLIFQTYTLAPFSEGTLHITVSKELIDYYKRYNNNHD
jgi:hypothetical protein